MALRSKTVESNTPLPVIEPQLAQIYRDQDALRTMKRRLTNYGLSEVELPNPAQCQALAVLGDWQRHRLLQSDFANGSFEHLVRIGLVDCQVDQVSTPILRMLAGATRARAGVRSVAEQLAHPAALHPLEPGLLQCPVHVQGWWGQPARLHWQTTRRVDYLRIAPDPIFGVAPALIATGKRDCVGDFGLDIDQGQVSVRLLADGRIYEQRIQIERLPPQLEGRI